MALVVRQKSLKADKSDRLLRLRVALAGRIEVDKGYSHMVLMAGP